LRGIELEPTKTRLIGTECIGQHKGIASVVFRSRDTVTVPEPVELLGVHGKDVEVALDQPFDHRATRHFDGHSYPLRLARRQSPQPVRQAGQTGTIMVNGPFPHQATVAVEHTDLMPL
jgi:hypothetical protein